MNPSAASELLRKENVITDSVADPDYRSKFFPPRIRIEEFKYFYQKKLSLSSRKYDPGLFILDPDPDFLPIPDPGVKNAPDPGSGSATLITERSVADPDPGSGAFLTPSGLVVYPGLYNSMLTIRNIFFDQH